MDLGKLVPGSNLLRFKLDLGKLVPPEQMSFGTRQGLQDSPTKSPLKSGFLNRHITTSPELL